MPAKGVTLRRQYLTNNCINLLWQIGPTDMAEAMNYIARAANSIRTHPQWSDFWNATPPCRDWSCPTCGAPHEVHDDICFVCRNRPYEFSSEESSEKSDGKVSEGNAREAFRRAV